ncbi:MAG: anhydro-N-acetylmuramic acid kinase [Lysobacter sp.]|nr:anhydro-N-acetylmuramic acid kinase [Lysobacter sp.]
MRGLAIGIMSGTSLDGADAVLADFSAVPPRCVAASSLPFPADLKQGLLALSTPGSDGLDAAGACSVRLADIYAEAVALVLEEASLPASAVEVIGCHGQTVRHRPDLGFTIQLNDAARLAERAGIDVVADFRSRDVAAGGQGAPLVPAFHDAVFRHPSLHRVVVNIGGIANASSLTPGHSFAGFDTGPGNVLMDGWARRHLGAEFDVDGHWASQGRVIPGLLARLLEEPFFAKPPPRSTGRELFNEAWLAARLGNDTSPADVQATLLELTARTVMEAIGRHCGTPDEVYLCGGGARNARLAARIGELASPCPVYPTDRLGVPTGRVEAMAFAWLALKCARREPLDLAAVTGARHPCILGALYPA